MQTKKQIDSIVENDKNLSPELKKLFQEHPEKKEEYKEKLYDSQMSGGGRVTTHKWCDTCMFAQIIKPLGRQPQTRYCRIFEPKDSQGKPDEVIFYGEKCEYYEKEK